MNISDLIAQLETLRTRFGDLPVITTEERHGDLVYVEVVGASIDDFDGEDSRKVVLNLDFDWEDN